MRLKVIFFLLILFMIYSCEKSNRKSQPETDADLPAPYDTVAIDSFSVGASSSVLTKPKTLLSDSLKKKVRN